MHLLLCCMPCIDSGFLSFLEDHHRVLPSLLDDDGPFRSLLVSVIYLYLYMDSPPLCLLCLDIIVVITVCVFLAECLVQLWGFLLSYESRLQLHSFLYSPFDAFLLRCKFSFVRLLEKRLPICYFLVESSCHSFCATEFSRRLLVASCSFSSSFCSPFISLSFCRCKVFAACVSLTHFLRVL